MSDLISDLEAEAVPLVFDTFDEATALELGLALLARAKGQPVVISIRNASRTLFHVALPGSAPLNDLWARRKSATALVTNEASYLTGLRHREKGIDITVHGLDEAGHSDSGGAVPIRVRGVGVVAVAVVSGLPQEKDHALVVAAIRDCLGQGAAG